MDGSGPSNRAMCKQFGETNRCRARMQEVGELKNSQWLSLIDTDVTDSGEESCGIPKLKWLYLGGSKVTDASLSREHRVWSWTQRHSNYGRD